MGQLIESDYGFLNSAQEQIKFLSEKFFNLKNRKIDDYFYIKNSKLRTMPTFSIDELLPSMPVPELENTLAKYLECIKPFVNEQEYKNTENLVNKFKSGQGQILQRYLKEKASHERNWLEKYWLDYAYLEWRDPIAPFVNTAGFVSGTSEDYFLHVPENFKLNIALARISMQCFYYTGFHDDLRNERYPIHKSRSEFFSMDQWYRLFNTCRIPCIGRDKLDVHFKTVRESDDCPSHIIVMYRYRFYRIESHHEGKRLNLTEFYKQLEKVYSYGNNQSFGVGIGALSADYRNDWAKNRQYLIDLHHSNKESFDQIEQSMYLCVLDETEAFNNSELCKLGLTGDPKNRFFDKSFQAICTKNGRFTSNVDHTPFDGMTSTSLIRETIIQTKKDKWDLTMTDTYEARPGIPEPQEIHFVYDTKIENEIKKCTELFNRNAGEILCKEVKLVNCNKEMIKTFKTNPDTFVQMCMQLAYYQVHKKPAPTYESATTRGYYHGRTETVRSCTSQALDWCKQMCNHDKSTRLSDKQLLELFKKACKKHDELMNEARLNCGVDRHMLGLKLIARDVDMKTPEIFSDPSWKRSGGDGNFVLSSSCLGFGNVAGTCAAMCLDGYSMIYCFPDTGITFELGKYLSSKETCLRTMEKSLQSAIDQTKDLFKPNSKI